MAILVVKKNINTVPDSPGKWKAGEVVTAVADDHVFSVGELPAAGEFYHVTITDKTVAEVQTYLKDWAHSSSIAQIARKGDGRRIEVTSDMVSRTRKHKFLRATILEILTRMGATYVSHTDNSFRFDITATDAEAPSKLLQLRVGLSTLIFARRRWYINTAGMTFLSNNAGVASGTAAQVSNYLRDGLLD